MLPNPLLYGTFLGGIGLKDGGTHAHGFPGEEAKLATRDCKITDSGSLYLCVTRKGAKSWQLKYRFADREKRLVVGLYPEVTLDAARKLRDEARQELRDFRDQLRAIETSPLAPPSR